MTGNSAGSPRRRAAHSGYSVVANKRRQPGGPALTGRTEAKHQTFQRRGIASEELRRHNLATVLEQLHRTGPASRSQLTATTGLNRSTVGDLIGELAALGLVDEGKGSERSGPGRPSPIVHPRADGATTLAIELSVDSTAVAVVGLGGVVLDKVRVARPRARRSAKRTLSDAAGLAGDLLDARPGDRNLVGVGIAVAGVTRRADGFVHIAPNLGWRDVPVAGILGAALEVGVPIQVANEADLAALAEHLRGAGVGVNDLIYISGEVGVGAGILHDGRPMLGSAGYAGEVGHARINPDGRECRCGSTGCWETEVGEETLARRAGIGFGGPGIVEEVLVRAGAGDEAALAAIEEVGSWLGLGIGNLINIFNPEAVLLGGFYHSLFPYLSEAVETASRRSALSAPGAMAKIWASGLGPDAPLYGAAELAFSDLLADPAGASTRLRDASRV